MQRLCRKKTARGHDDHYECCSMLVESGAPLVRYEGRWAHTPDGATADWPLTAVAVKFSCLEAGPVSALLDGAANRFLASFTAMPADADDKTVGEEATEVHRTTFTAEAPGAVRPVVLGEVQPGVYVARLCKLTEASHSGVPRLGCLGRMLGMQAPMTFGGWQLPEGSTVLPMAARPTRRVEFMGGSDTCGFGADCGSDGGCSAMLRNEVHNGDLCYSAELARRLGAEVHVEAWSGKGVVMNAFQGCGIFGCPPLPELLNRTLATSAEPEWDFSSWTPDLVVLDVGGNDYNNCCPTSEQRFVRAYVEMLEQLRRAYPQAVLLNICGGSVPSDPRRNKAAGRVECAVQQFADPSVVFVEVPVGVVADEDPPGHFGHHGPVGHNKICDFLEPQIRKLMGWFRPATAAMPEEHGHG